MTTLSDIKECAYCREDKIVNNFGVDKKRKDGLHPYCKTCRSEERKISRALDPAKFSEYSKKYREKNPEKYAAYNFAYNHGLTKEDVLGMVEVQGGCKICHVLELGIGSKWHVDHDHLCCESPKSCKNCQRGILCSSCNFMLGQAKDNIEVLENAIRYLKEHKGVRT